MRTRAYRPEAPACLENRALLSAAAGPPADPVVLSLRRFNFVLEHSREAFDLFRRYRDVIQLRDEVDDVVVQIPFEGVDGLGDSIDRIVNRMRHDLAAHVPHAIRSAQDDVLAATRAEVLARVRAGDVVVR
jgi:hypothetical protein